MLNMKSSFRLDAAVRSRRSLGTPIAAAAQQFCRRLQQCSNRRHRAGCSTATAAAVQTDAGQQLVIDATPYIGPIQVEEIEGAGRGVVATRDVAPGELLLCCHPLAVVTGPQQQRLSVGQLQVQLASHITPTVTAWLGQLYDGTQQSMQHLPDLQAAAAVQQQQQAQADLLHSLRQQQQQQECAGSVSSSSGSSSAPEVTDALLQHIMDVVRYNAYSDLHDDLAAAAAAGEEPVSLIGLYPEFSFFNHSCVPNCINWVLPGQPRAMVVRAARHIAAGEEATISYLGAPQLLPLEGRQQALGNFGFVCRCGRCTSEEELPGDVAELLDDIVSRVYQSFTPRLQTAVESGDTAAAGEVRQQAAAMMTLLYQQFRRHLIRPQQRQQLLASAFNCLELIADAAAAEGNTAAAADGLQKCLEAAAAVTSGSDLHCITSAKLAAVLEADSSSSSSSSSSMLAAAAERAVAAAHTARYGQLSQGQLRWLTELNRTLYV